MKTTLTITSKRQLTIPRKLWDALELEGTRYLEADLEKGVLRLRKVDFNARMEDFWAGTRAAVTGDISDASIRLAGRKARHRRSV